ncbi:GNAT family N-acetyltransferase [Streptomyces sp. AC555_RSS877]|uniref:GNAT family N-acetyltransferase n=1 Tax=Streptomyces sp. AC555_RSS877 TaxID=2823688 RepID=UPI001C27D95B|nr:GNAT family N-acetyltransferase [Streptomyces sp. AC555_RSS877]
MSHRQTQQQAPREWVVRTGEGPVRVTSPVPREKWAQVLAADPRAMAFHRPEWVDCVCEVGGWQDAGRLYRTGEGRELLLPMVRRPGRPDPLAVRASLPPGWGTGGILAPGGVRAHEFGLVLTDLAADQTLRTRIRPSFGAAHELRAPAPGYVSIPRTVHVLDLDGGMDAVWSQRWSKRVRGNMRSAQRRAERAGLVIESGNSPELVEIYYDLYLRWLEQRARERHLPPAVVRSRGKRAEPLAKYHAVAAALPGVCRILLATVGGRPVAAMIALRHGAVWCYWRGCSDKEMAGPLRANQLLMLHSIERACEAGCRYFEMGESGGVASLERFKARMGGVKQPVTEHRLERVPLTRWQNRVGGILNAVKGARPS